MHGKRKCRKTYGFQWVPNYRRYGIYFFGEIDTEYQAVAFASVYYIDQITRDFKFWLARRKKSIIPILRIMHPQRSHELGMNQWFNCYICHLIHGSQIWITDDYLNIFWVQNFPAFSRGFFSTFQNVFIIVSSMPQLVNIF